MSPRPPRRRRGLSAEDRAIWDRVRQGATPLHPDRRAPSPVSVPVPRAPEPPPDPPAPLLLRPFGPSEPRTGFRPGPPRPGPVGRPEPGLDRRTADRLRRGTRAPDARIDLHGMSAARAHARLDRFLGEAMAAGHRCVLVITGKGGRRGSAQDAPFMTPEDGVLRRAAPRWIRSGPFATRIVGIYEAHARHGGAGAFYVYLKKGR